MATTDPTTQMLAVRDGWDKAYPSAVPSGINGDPAHFEDPGKHISRSDNIRLFGSGAWCVILPIDKAGPADKACAWDMNLGRTDQNLCHNRLIQLYRDRNTDPRAKYIHAFNGYNGTGSPMRYNLRNGATAVTDNSHSWHEHLETHYGYVNDPAMTDAVLSVLRGETMAAYIGRTVKRMAAIEMTTRLGGDTGLDGRTVQNHMQDLQNLRGALIGEKHPAAARQVVNGSPLWGITMLPALVKSSQDQAVEIGKLHAKIDALTELVRALTKPGGL